MILHAGVVIGADGFGYIRDEKERHVKINQIGRVIIEDFVEIGANSCVDRATLGTTIIKEGVKIDNLVQVAHNCVIGENSLVVAQVGIGGGCALGSHVTLAGQVGVADQITIGNQVVVAAKAGGVRDVENSETHGGYPNVPLTTWKKYSTLFPKLADMIQKIRKLEKRVLAIENRKTKR